MEEVNLRRLKFYVLTTFMFVKALEYKSHFPGDMILYLHILKINIKAIY